MKSACIALCASVSVFLLACSNDTFVGDDASNNPGDASSSDVVTGDAPSDGATCSCDLPSGVCRGSVCVVPMLDTSCLTVAGGYVYWTNGQTIAAGGAVYRMKITTSEVELVADGEDTPRGITTDGNVVVWTTKAAIRRTPITSSAPTTVVPATNPYLVAINGNDVMWADDATDIFFYDGAGVPSVVDVASGTPAYMYGTPLRVYWTTDTGAVDAGSAQLFSAPWDGGNKAIEYAVVNDGFAGLAVNDQSEPAQFLFAEYGRNRITSLLNTAVTVTSANVPNDLVQDTSGNLYWSERRDGGAIMKVDSLNTTPIAVQLASANYPHCVALGDPNIYWTAPGLVTPGTASQ